MAQRNAAAPRPAAAASDAPTKPEGPIRRYLAASRTPVNTLLLLLPLFLIYSVGILVTDGVRIGVDPLSEVLLHVVCRGDRLIYFLVHLGCMAAFLVAALALRRKHLFQPRIYLLVMAEGAIYGLTMGLAVGNLLVYVGLRPELMVPLAASPTAPGPLAAFALSLGAGLWEEIVFRFALLGGLVLLCRRVLKMRAVWAWTLGVLVSSIAFSLIHHVGSLAEPFTLYAFVFRFFAGAVFAGIYAARGLAVVVYTHALYDIMVMVL